MKLPFCILLFSFTVFAQDALKNSDLSASPHYHIDSPDHVCGSPMFTEEFISNNRERMRTLYPDEYQRMLMPKTLNKTYKVGMTEKFWVSIDDTTAPGQTKDVEIMARSDLSQLLYYDEEHCILLSPNSDMTVQARSVNPMIHTIINYPLTIIVIAY